MKSLQSCLIHELTDSRLSIGVMKMPFHKAGPSSTGGPVSCQIINAILSRFEHVTRIANTGNPWLAQKEKW